MQSSLLSSGIYSIPQAAMLLEIHPARLRGWVCGKSGAKGKPLIRTQLARVDHHIALSFVNLIEAKFIASFASMGLSVLSMRYMAEEAERFLKHPHPFATDWIFKTDGKKIFAQATERANDPCLYDLKKHNFAMHSVLEQGFIEGIEFNANGLAGAWFPRKTIAPRVLVSPKISFGAPALADSGVPTEALCAAYVAEDGDADTVARWFDVSSDEVVEAVKFEANLKPVH